MAAAGLPLLLLLVGDGVAGAGATSVSAACRLADLALVGSSAAGEAALSLLFLPLLFEEEASDLALLFLALLGAGEGESTAST